MRTNREDNSGDVCTGGILGKMLGRSDDSRISGR
jgi:hypothetical protein